VTVRYRKFWSSRDVSSRTTVGIYDLGSNGTDQRFGDEILGFPRIEALKFLETLDPKDVISVCEVPPYNGGQYIIYVYYRTNEPVKEDVL
jgi:hypothetical protein